MDGQESECKVGESKEEHKVHKQREMGVLQSIGIKGSVGGILGYCSGSFAKQVSRIVIFYAGCASLFLTVLSFCDYIKINWKKIDADIFHIIAKSEKKV